jgi:uncharacterized protein
MTHPTDNRGIRQYPTLLQAIHLVILYIFIQTVVDFPLALIDYFKGTEYLYQPLKKIVLGVGSVLFILWYGYRKTGNRVLEVFPFKKFNPLIVLLLLFFFLGIQQWLNIFNSWIDMVLPPPAWFWEMFDKVFESDFGFWGAFMKVVIIAPVVEESIFRGVIMHGLMRNYSKGMAIFFSGLLFALFHMNPWQFTATFLLGVLLGWIMIRTRNIGLCILGHAMNNLLVLLSITNYQYLKQTQVAEWNLSTVLLISTVLIIVSLVLISLVTRGRKTIPAADLSS